MKVILIIITIFLSTPIVCYAGDIIDLSIIKQIESSGDPSAYNQTSQARGLYQITPICLEEWNNYHPAEQYMLTELFNPRINERIARWYLLDRIPQMLRYYKKSVTIENCIIAYNAGIGYMASDKKLPSETIEYIKKYKQMGGN